MPLPDTLTGKEELTAAELQWWDELCRQGWYSDRKLLPEWLIDTPVAEEVRKLRDAP